MFVLGRVDERYQKTVVFKGKVNENHHEISKSPCGR